MKKRNLAIILCSLVLVCSLAVGGTIAYLTDDDAARNTFTVGDIDITLTETLWDNDVDGKDMYPGTTVYKNPVVTATEGDSYVRVKLEVIDTANGDAVITDTARLALIMDTVVCDTAGTLTEGTGYSKATVDALPMISSSFTADTAHSAAGTYYYNYNAVLEDGDSTPALFTTIAVPTDYDAADLALMGSYAFVITVQGIQAENFASAADAFAELNTEFPA